MAEFEVMQIHLSDWAIVHRLKELVIEYEQLKAYWDDRRKGREGMEQTTIDMASPLKLDLQRNGNSVTMRCVHLEDSLRAIKGNTSVVLATLPGGKSLRSSGNSSICWREGVVYVNGYDHSRDGMCCFVTFDSEDEAIGFVEKVEQLVAIVNVRYTMTKTLTGQAWAAKQTCGTMFEIAGSWWLFVISIRNFMIIIRDGKCVGDQPCWVDGKWENWPDCLDPVCDAHVIHRPKGGDDQR